MPTSDLQGRHIEHLKWAISLARANLDQCTEGDWLKWKEGFYDFVFWALLYLRKPLAVRQRTEVIRQRGSLEGGGIFLTPESKDKFFDRLTKEGLTDMAADWEALFMQIAFDLSTNDIVVGSDKELRFSIGWPSVSGPIIHRVVVRPLDYRLMGRIAIGEHLHGSGLGPERFTSCHNCHSICITNRKRDKKKFSYCSSRCARNAATKAYRHRNREAELEKERKRSKARYRKRILSKRIS
jgi:hypothetical protein